MENEGWRTLILDDSFHISYENGMLITGDGNVPFPIEQLRMLMVGASVSGFSSKLLCDLARKNVKLVICDEKHDPIAELVSDRSHFMTSGKLCDQIKWPPERKDDIWKQIVQTKIAGQISVLQFFGIEVPQKLIFCRDNVLPSDLDNREGQAARLYFHRLFGNSFSRKSDNDINAALNYGYSVIRSYLNRLIAIHGYDLSLGVKHCSKTNPFNLSCDLMEPFRPMIDQVVCLNRGRLLDWKYKKELVALMYTNVKYGSDKMEMHTAMDQFSSSVFKLLEGKKAEIKKVKAIA